jgi:hypothetical protein
VHIDSNPGSVILTLVVIFLLFTNLSMSSDYLVMADSKHKLIAKDRESPFTKVAEELPFVYDQKRS